MALARWIDGGLEVVAPIWKDVALLGATKSVGLLITAVIQGNVLQVMVNVS